VTAAPAAASSEIKTGAPSRSALDAAWASEPGSDDVSTAIGADANSSWLIRTDVIAALFSAMTDAASRGTWVTAASGAGELGGGADVVGAGAMGDGWVSRSGWLVHAATETAKSAREVATQTRPRRGAVTTQSTTRTP